MDDHKIALISFVVGVIAGFIIFAKVANEIWVEPMDALGIEKFQKCEINTTNCHSNWYEIVYKKEKQK